MSVITTYSGDKKKKDMKKTRDRHLPIKRERERDRERERQRRRRGRRNRDEKRLKSREAWLMTSWGMGKERERCRREGRPPTSNADKMADSCSDHDHTTRTVFVCNRLVIGCGCRSDLPKVLSRKKDLFGYCLFVLKMGIIFLFSVFSEVYGRFSWFQSVIKEGPHELVRQAARQVQAMWPPYMSLMWPQPRPFGQRFFVILCLVTFSFPLPLRIDDTGLGVQQKPQRL